MIGLDWADAHTVAGRASSATRARRLRPRVARVLRTTKLPSARDVVVASVVEPRRSAMRRPATVCAAAQSSLVKG